MTKEEILNSARTKTWKMEQLFGLGLTRREVAELVGVGYGFAQNVYARLYPERLRRRARTIVEVIEEAEWRLTNFTFNHTFGVEIEACGINREELETELNAAGIPVRNEAYNHQNRPHWKIVNDGSLRGNSTFELVSPKLHGEEGLRQLKTVTLILRGLEARINSTCGLHIHFDASEFDLGMWKRLFKNYAKIEPLIDSFMPDLRRANNNTFCRSMRLRNYEDNIDRVSSLEEMTTGLRQLQNNLTGGSRYYKLNTQSYWVHKSVEFRQHAGTVNFKKMQNWILFLARFVEFSKQAEFTAESDEQLRRFLPDEIIGYIDNRRRELEA